MAKSSPASTRWRATRHTGRRPRTTSAPPDPSSPPTLPDGSTRETCHTAWIYLAGPGTAPTTMSRITDDNWLAHVSAR